MGARCNMFPAHIDSESPRLRGSELPPTCTVHELRRRASVVVVVV